MRRIALTAAVAFALAACSPQQSPEPKAPETAATPAKTAESAPVAPKAEEPAAKPAADVPEGDCGDQSKLPADQRVANTARWTTASEQDNFGFNVYRGDTEKGDFKKLNEKPILGAGTSDETHKYEYADDTIDPCKDYWYYIEQVSTKGVHEKISPVFHAPAKRKPRGSGSAAN